MPYFCPSLIEIDGGNRPYDVLATQVMPGAKSFSAQPRQMSKTEFRYYSPLYTIRVGADNISPGVDIFNPEGADIISPDDVNDYENTTWE